MADAGLVFDSRFYWHSVLNESRESMPLTHESLGGSRHQGSGSGELVEDASSSIADNLVAWDRSSGPGFIADRSAQGRFSLHGIRDINDGDLNISF